MESSEVVLCTTQDADIHVLPYELTEAQMRINRLCPDDLWLKTIDDRLIKARSVVSIWTPSDFELQTYLSGMEED